MMQILFSKDSVDFLDHIGKKIRKQISNRIFLLEGDPMHPFSKQLKGDLSHYRSMPAGEYRICYKILNEKTLNIEHIGHRNDDEPYKKLKRKAR